MRTTVLGSLLDVAQRNLARGADARRASSSPAASTCPRRRASTRRRIGPSTRCRGLRRRAGGAGSRAAPDRLPRGRAAGGRSPGGATASPADFFALKGVARGARRPARRVARLRGGRGAVPAPGPLGRLVVAGERRRLDRRAAPTRLPGLGHRGRGRLRSRPGGARRRGTAGEETFEDVTTFPAVNQDLAVVVPAEVCRRPSVRDAVLAGGGELLRAAEVFDLYEGEQVGEGSKSLALRLEFRAADRTLTDEEVAELPRPRSRPRWRRSGGRSVAEPTSTTARRRSRRAGPGRRRLRLHRRARRPDRLAPPEAGAGRRDLAQRRRQAARPPLPALPGAARADRARPRRDRGHRRRDRRLPARRLGADRRGAARRWARSSSTSPPTSACATCRPTSAGTASTAPPSCSRARSTASPSSTASSCARPSWSPRPAATRPRACWRWRRSPRRACSPTS